MFPVTVGEHFREKGILRCREPGGQRGAWIVLWFKRQSGASQGSGLDGLAGTGILGGGHAGLVEDRLFGRLIGRLARGASSPRAGAHDAEPAAKKDVVDRCDRGRRGPCAREASRAPEPARQQAVRGRPRGAVEVARDHERLAGHLGGDRCDLPGALAEQHREMRVDELEVTAVPGVARDECAARL